MSTRILPQPLPGPGAFESKALCPHFEDARKVSRTHFSCASTRILTQPFPVHAAACVVTVHEKDATDYGGLVEPHAGEKEAPAGA
jgi:hypothetical protein